MKIRKYKAPEFNGKFWDFFIANRDKRFIVLVGGAGSSKSYSTAQWFVHLLYTVRDKKFLVARKNFPSLKITAMQLILDLLDEYGLPYDLNRSAPVMLTNPYGNQMLFRGLDDPEKIKSYEPDFTWLEETSDFQRRDFTQINLRMRGLSDITKQLYMSFNPVGKAVSWIYDIFWEQKRKNAAILQSTWRDNYKHLDAEYIAELEALEQESKELHKVYNLGEWAELENIMYTNWGMVKSFPQATGDRFYGLDFGYTHEMALTEHHYIDGEIFEKELIYQTHLTTPQLIEKMKALIPVKSDPVYADSAEPDRIAEIRKAGFNCLPSKKSREHGLDFVKRIHTNIVEPSPNFEKEKRSYVHQVIEATGEVLEDAVKWFDHLMDAERYAIYTHLWKRLRKRVGRDKPVTKETLGVP